MEFEHLSGMESISHEFDNTFNLAAGMEAIALAGAAESYDGFEANYAHTVLTLNDIDVSGQEGFLDGIKKGARKVYEWIRDLIKSIRAWFTGSSKADYEKAKKEITEDLELVKRVKELKEKGVDAYIKHDPDEGIVRIIKRMPPDVKKAVNEEIKQVDIPNVTTPEELNESIRGTVINDIAAKVASRINGIERHVAEIKRIDPNGETLKSLGINPDMNVIVNNTKNKEALFSREDQKRFVKATNSLITASDAAQKELAAATVALDRMNEAGKGHDEQAHQLSRAVAVVRELTDIAAGYRDMIITISSQLNMGYKHAATKIVRDAILEALKTANPTADRYIKEEMDALGL